MTTQPGDLKANIKKFSLPFVFALVAVILMPSGAIDPWNLISPKLLLLMLVLVMGIQFVSYVAIALRRKEGLLLMATLIGVVNSNVINGAMASISKQDSKLADYAAAAVVCGNLAMLGRNAMIATTLGAEASLLVVPPILAMLLTGIVAVVLRIRQKNQEIGELDLAVENPFAIKTALQFTLIITLVTVAGFIVHSAFGNMGLYLTSFFSVYAAGGPIIMSSVMLASGGHITYMAAATVIMIASISSVSNDAVIQLLCGAKPLAISFIKITIPIVVAGLGTLAIEWMLLA